MSSKKISRRSAMTTASLGLGGLITNRQHTSKIEKKASLNSVKPFSFCLNASTLRGQKLGIVGELEVASKAGFDGMEVWINGIQAYLNEGGTLKDLKMRIDDLGLKIEDAIGFAQWIVDDEDVRTKAMEQLKVEMDMLAQIGCARIAAPPAGATNEAGLNLDAAGERYHAILDLGVEFGVIPQLELWGFSANLHKLSQVVYVAAESGHPAARILPDVYHLYKGGSDFHSLKLLNPDIVEIFHVNDYPASPSRTEMNDSHRVYPGDGVAPMRQILSDLRNERATTVLSLELFNQDYWAQDALEVAKTGLAKMKASVENI